MQVVGSLKFLFTLVVSRGFEGISEFNSSVINDPIKIVMMILMSLLVVVFLIWYYKQTESRGLFPTTVGVKFMRNIAIIFVLTAFSLLSGCASQVMKSAENQTLPGLTKDKSRIVFMRSALHGTVVRAGFYIIENEKPKFLGVLANDNKMFNDIKPGTHTFMSAGSTGLRFLTGNFKAGKTYYIAATPRGWPGINFSLYPFRGDGNGKFVLDSPVYLSMLEDTVLVVPSPGSREWADNEQNRVNVGFEAEWPIWKNQSSSFKAPFTIRSGDGV